MESLYVTVFHLHLAASLWLLLREEGGEERLMLRSHLMSMESIVEVLVVVIVRQLESESELASRPSREKELDSKKELKWGLEER